MSAVYRCGDCQWCFHDEIERIAMCRVSHPANWRTVHPDDWCGRFIGVNQDEMYYTPPRKASMDTRFP